MGAESGRSDIGGRVGLLVANDIVRAGIRSVLDGAREFDEVCVIDDTRTPRDAVDTDLDAIIVDLELPGSTLTELLTRARETAPDAGVLGLCRIANPRLTGTLTTRGFRAVIDLRTSASELVDAVRNVMSPKELASLPSKIGSTREAELSVKEHEVLLHLAAGKTNKAIGILLDIAEGTVKRHTNSIYRKLNVISRTHAVLEAQRRGYS